MIIHAVVTRCRIDADGNDGVPAVGDYAIVPAGGKILFQGDTLSVKSLNLTGAKLTIIGTIGRALLTTQSLFVDSAEFYGYALQHMASCAQPLIALLICSGDIIVTGSCLLRSLDLGGKLSIGQTASCLMPDQIIMRDGAQVDRFVAHFCFEVGLSASMLVLLCRS
jgi:hypothetical protein